MLKYNHYVAESGTKIVNVYSFGLVCKKPQRELLNSRNKLRDEIHPIAFPINETAEFQFQQYTLITNYMTLKFQCRCNKSYDNVEIITRNASGQQLPRSQEKYKIEARQWYEVAKITEKDISNNPSWVFYFDLYFYSVITSKMGIFLHDLMKSELFSDVVIVSSDGKNFNVHKNIIASKSDVFKAHLMHNTKSGIIESTFDAEVVSELLSYIYCESLNNLDSVFDRLLAAADFYKIDDLKSLCALRLCKKLTVDNAIDIYKLADLYKIESDLKNHIIRFIDIHRKEISQSDAWSEFENVVLMKDVLYSFLSVYHK